MRRLATAALGAVVLMAGVGTAAPTAATDSRGDSATGRPQLWSPPRWDRCSISPGLQLCIGFEYRITGGQRAVAKIVDRKGGYDYQVWTRNLIYFHYPRGGGSRSYTYPDADGRKDVRDFARTGPFCHGGRFGAHTYFYWKRKHSSTIHRRVRFSSHTHTARC